jgi:hypothetical protein
MWTNGIVKTFTKEDSWRIIIIKVIEIVIITSVASIKLGYTIRNE